MNADKAQRLLALDALRGAIVIVMALDHANDFVARSHPPPEMWTGFFPSYPDAISFLTRFVTHLAAPGFFFLMGAGMVLLMDSRLAAGWSIGAIARHFVGRGILLILLQFTLENFAWSRLTGLSGYFGVLYGLGTAMILGTLLLRMNSIAVAVISSAAIIGTHLALLFAPASSVPVILRALLIPGSTGNVTVYYPTIPWLGVVGVGILYARWLARDSQRAYRAALLIGVGCVALFSAVRAWGGFGNIRAAQGSDWIAFFNVVKYPPSLVLLLWTIGVDMLLLALFARFARLSRLLAVFGSSALFFYVAHLYLYALIGMALGRGTGLISMYPYWLLGLAVLYPLCWAYAKFKYSQPPDSLVRFF